MSLYCPQCLSNEIYLPNASIVHVVINDMRADLHHILFGPTQDGEILHKSFLDQEHILFNSNQGEYVFKQDLTKKIERFFNQYQHQPKKNPVRKINIFSSDYVCANDCALKGINISVINDLISPHTLDEDFKRNRQKILH